MTSALAVLLAVLSAAIGVLNSSTTAVPTPIGVGRRLYARTRATAEWYRRRVHRRPRRRLGGARRAVRAGAGAADPGRGRGGARVSALPVDERAHRSDPHVRRARRRWGGCSRSGASRCRTTGWRDSPPPARCGCTWTGYASTNPRSRSLCDHIPRSWSSWAGTSRRIGSTSSRRAHETAVQLSAGCDGRGRGARRLRRRELLAGAAFDRSGAAVLARPGSSRRRRYVRASPPSFRSRSSSQDGKPLIHYRTGPGPHTGVHVILVRDDLSTIVHRHPPIAPDGRVRDPVTLTEPGPYHVLVDIYPASKGPGYTNVQLTQSLRVRGKYTPQPIPPFSRTVVTEGYRFTMQNPPKLRVAEAALVTVTVQDPDGQPAHFTPWYGALAHAIFFHKDDLAYFHTHVCAPGLAGCTNVAGGATHLGYLGRSRGCCTWGCCCPRRVSGGCFCSARWTARS